MNNISMMLLTAGVMPVPAVLGYVPPPPIRRLLVRGVVEQYKKCHTTECENSLEGLSILAKYCGSCAAARKAVMLRDANERRKRKLAALRAKRS